MRHIPVLIEHIREIFVPLRSCSNAVFIDCTLGLGGHSREILELCRGITLIGIDKDSNAIALARENLADFSDRIEILHANFAQGFAQALELARSQNKRVVGVLADIGVSSLQLDDMSRGFSFISDRLDMRMDTRQAQSASSIIAEYSQYALEEILRNYGQIPESKKMARLIKEFANTYPRDGGFYNAQSLSEFISKHFSKHRPHSKLHAATLAFQALRIEVNNELGVLRALLDSIEQASSADLRGAIVGIISFHSLEDRLVKERFKHFARACICPSDAIRCTCGANHSKGTILTKKPLVANPKEVCTNPRSRSAKLRAFALQ